MDFRLYNVQLQTFQSIFGFAALVTGCGMLIGESRTAAALSSANAPAVAWSAGVIRINGADHSGSGNLLPGARLETLRNSGQLYLADGTRMRLGAATSMSVQRQSVSLEGGIARIDSIPAPNRQLNIVAGELQVKAGGGVIARPRAEELIVTAASTPTEVRRTNGVLVAMVRPGETLSFSVGSAAKSADTRMTGKVWGENGHYFLEDEVTSLKTELQGGRPGSYEGMRVQARGELLHSGAEGRRTLVVKEYLMAQAQSGAGAAGSAGTPAVAAGTTSAGTAAAGTAGGGAGGAAAAGGGAAAATAGAVAGAAGLSTTIIVGVTVATLAGVGTSLALVSRPSEPPISQ